MVKEITQGAPIFLPPCNLETDFEFKFEFKMPWLMRTKRLVLCVLITLLPESYKIGVTRFNPGALLHFVTSARIQEIGEMR